MKRKKKVYDDDDGRVISSMNVDGMPWYRAKSKDDPLEAERMRLKREEDELQLTKKEKRAMMGGVFAAALLVAGVFALAGLLFILFCLYVWFK